MNRWPCPKLQRCQLPLLICVALLGPVFLARAFEVVYAPTGYQVSSGMDYAIKYELKNLIARHAAAFQRREPKEFKITYRIFLTYEEYEKYSALNQRPVSRSLLGYTISSSESRRDTGEIITANAEIVSWKQDQPARQLTVVLHETTHAVTHAFLHQVPLWMNEGSAEWFGRPTWANSDAQKTDRARRWQTLKGMLDRNEIPPLRVYLETESYEQWDKLFAGNRAQGYIVGYSLFDYFMSQSNAANFLAAVVRRADVERSGQPSTVFTAQLEKYWSGGLKGFENGWYAWIRRSAEREKLPPPKPEPEKAKSGKKN